MTQRTGYVALLGEPNAGKSTLLNQILKVKLSIVTHKVQTTRRKILGVHMQGDTQLIFLDTPGLFQPKKPLEKAMVKSAWGGAHEADALGFLIDAQKKNIEYSKKLLSTILDLGKPTFLILNKVDLIQKEHLLELATHLGQDPRVQNVFMISALQNSGVTHMIQAFAALMPEGPWFFDQDQLSDVPMRVLVAEMTREKVFLNVHQELPYQMTVQTEKWEEFDNGSVKISQVIHVLKDNYKKIILGIGGERLKRIGMQARKEMEVFLGRRVHLQLFVRVTEDWIDRLQELEAVDLGEKKNH